jgi:hypothetical protein
MLKTLTAYRFSRLNKSGRLQKYDGPVKNEFSGSGYLARMDKNRRAPAAPVINW